MLTNGFNKKIIYVLLGLIGIADFIFLRFMKVGLNVGTVFPGIIGLLFLLIGLFEYQLYKFISLKSQLKTKKGGILRKILYSIGLTWLISFLVIESLILFATNIPNPKDTPDYIIVLGAGLDGDRIPPSLLNRLNTSLYYISKYPESLIIVSGGMGAGESISEAQAMKDYLVSNGVSAKQIIVENQSTSTMENFAFTKNLLEKESSSLSSKSAPQKMLIVTNDFHMFRAKMLAKRNGFVPYKAPAPTPWYLKPNVYFREYFAVVKSIILDQS